MNERVDFILVLIINTVRFPVILLSLNRSGWSFRNNQEKGELTPVPLRVQSIHPIRDDCWSEKEKSSRIELRKARSSMDVTDHCARYKGNLNRNPYCSWSHSISEVMIWMLRLKRDVRGCVTIVVWMRRADLLTLCWFLLLLSFGFHDTPYFDGEDIGTRDLFCMSYPNVILRWVKCFDGYSTCDVTFFH